jgi:hypothetical protein
MGKYDNYSNAKNIKAAQKKLDKLTRKRKPDLYKIELAKEKLETEKLFESCQIFNGHLAQAPKDLVKFSDDNRVMMFINKLIRYEDIESYRIVENLVNKSETVTKQRGGVSRAIVGGAIAGGVGAVVGAMTADSHSTTSYYTIKEGFLFQVFLKGGSGYQYEVKSTGIIVNRIHPKWLELGAKIQRIIDGKD